MQLLRLACNRPWYHLTIQQLMIAVSRQQARKQKALKTSRAMYQTLELLLGKLQSMEGTTATGGSRQQCLGKLRLSEAGSLLLRMLY